MSLLRRQLESSLGPGFVLRDELGGAGMSRVFLADELALRRRVVVKILPLEMRDAVSRERFRREIQLGASLQHPLIVPVFSAGEANGMPYYTMPYVQGVSLRDRLNDLADVRVDEAVAILTDVAKALSYAHAKGVVHRDIKPENILLTGGEDGGPVSAVVSDFGVAKALLSSRPEGEFDTITTAGIAVGTPTYMSPEQAGGKKIDHRADIYSWGIMAYEMLTGDPPFTESTTVRLLAAQVQRLPRPITEHRSSLPPALADLVMRCLAKDPAERPQQASELLLVLQRLSAPGAEGTRGTASRDGGLLGWIRTRLGDRR